MLDPLVKPRNERPVQVQWPCPELKTCQHAGQETKCAKRCSCGVYIQIMISAHKLAASLWPSAGIICMTYSIAACTARSNCTRESLQLHWHGSGMHPDGCVTLYPSSYEGRAVGAVAAVSGAMDSAAPALSRLCTSGASAMMLITWGKANRRPNLASVQD